VAHPLASADRPLPRPSGSPAATGVVFRERRHVPWWWFVAALCLALPTTEAVVVLGPEMSHHATAGFTAASLTVAAAVIGGLLYLLGRSDVEVTASMLRAGAAQLGPGHIGRARALDATQTRLLLGPGLRADAWLSLRPWIKTAVQIEVVDDESTPYWVVATRRPAELMAALDLIRRPSAGQVPTTSDAFAHRESTP
jgi:hypothetical protein